MQYVVFRRVINIRYIIKNVYEMKPPQTVYTIKAHGMLLLSPLVKPRVLVE